LDFRLILLVAPVMLFSIIAHEYAHGYAALKQGDTTALSLGRLTWNPLKHIDPLLTIVLPLVLAFAHAPIIGGAKPVPVDPRNYRHHRRGDIIVSLAGVATNILIAICCVILLALAGLLARSVPSTETPISILQAMLLYGVLLNLSLALFNLLPIPPLDGSHVLKWVLPRSWAVHYQRVGFAGIVILLLLMQVGFLNWMYQPVLLALEFVGKTLGNLILPTALLWFQR
jgi:Zn-dependent protease